MPAASGLNAIVAIMPFLGYNQEDSIVVNQAFLDRGGYRTLDVKTFSYSGSEQISKRPAKEPWKRSETSKFNNIDDDGLPTPGNYLHKDDIILSKYEEDEDAVLHDTSVKAKDKHGVVERVIVGHGKRRRKGEGEESAKINIMTYEMRVPEIGDKFAVRKIFFNTFQVPFSN
jgi:DNA-directed RNA polymerase II subunit RPB2